MPKKLWKAKDLASRVKSRAQARTRISELLRMIETNEKKKKAIDVRILKHRKEIRLLEEAWEEN